MSNNKKSKIDWIADLIQLKNELPKLHANKNQNSYKLFYDKIDFISNNYSKKYTMEIIADIGKAIATLRDAHTTLVFPQSHRLPFSCYCFEEGVFIIETDENYKDILHTKIKAINDKKIDDVIEGFSEIISHENTQYFLSSLPDFIVCSNILFGLNIIDDAEKIKITVEEGNGRIKDILLSSILYKNYMPYGKNEKLINYQNTDKYLWSRKIKSTYYINYNKCSDFEPFFISDIAEDIKNEILNDNKIKSIIIDLRNNSGGNSELFQPFLRWICNYEPIVNDSIKLYVIIGRDTFSSALLNAYYLKFNSNAIFIGENTGGKPNSYGEVKYLDLKSSGLLVKYSSRYYKLIDDDNVMYFTPEINFKVSFKDYLNNYDPCTEYILSK